MSVFTFQLPKPFTWQECSMNGPLLKIQNMHNSSLEPKTCNIYLILTPPPKKTKPFHYPDLSIQKHMSVSALFSNNLAVVVDYLTIQSLSVKNQFALSAKPKACQMLFFSYLFLNLIQVNYIFSDNKHNIIYLSYLLLATNFKGIFIWQSVIQVFLVEFYRIPFSLSHFPPVYCLVYVIGFMNMVNVQRKTWILMLSMNFKPWQKTAKD
jgi:hypothetical protein